MSAVRPFSEADVIAAFDVDIRDAGLRPDGPPIMDGERRRVRVEGDKGRQKSGSYRAHFDGGWPAGHIRNFRDESRSGNWRYQGDAPRLSEAERSALAKERAIREQAKARDTAARLEAIRDGCAARWDRVATAPVDHPYLARKGISPEGLRIDGDLLLVPMRDAEGRLRSIQTIAPDGTKLFPPGSQVQGLHCLFGRPTPDGVLLIAEGYATGRTLHEARIPGVAVAVAFSKANFVSIALDYRERFPGLRIGFCGDNDHRHPRRDPPLPNVGKVAAEEAARTLGEGAAAIVPFFAPDDAGTDWNDFAAKFSLEDVRLAVEAGLPPLLPAPPPPVRPRCAAPSLSTEGATALMERIVRKLLEEAAELHAIRAAWAKRKAEIDKEAPVGAPERERLLTHARRDMAKAHGAAWKRRATARGRRVFIKGSAGIGKSQLLSDLLSDLRRNGWDLGRVVYLSNLRKNFSDLAAETEGGFAVHGRLTEDPEATDGSTMCLRPAAADAVMRAGLPVSRTLCKSDDQTCPFYDRCGYQRDRLELEEGDHPFRFGAHEHLVHPAGAMQSPDVLVMDESFTHKVAAVASFGADRLSEAALARYPGATGTEQRFFLDDMASVLDALRDPRGNLAGLRERGFKTADDFKSLLFYVGRAIDKMLADAVGPCTADAEVEKQLARYRSHEMGRVRRMLESLRAEIHLPRDRAIGVEYRADEQTEVDGKKEQQDRIFVMWCRDISIPEHALVIALDGTGNDLLLRRVLGEDLEVVDARCERNVRITQVIDTPMPRRRLLGPGKPGAVLDDKNAKEAERQRQRAADLINGLAAKHGGPFFACTYLPVEALLGPHLSPDVLTGHFAGVRGSNDYEHCGGGAHIGREQTWPRASEDIARALYADDPDELNLTGEFITVKRGIRMRDGSAVMVDVQVHPDPRCQAVLEMMREDELAQVMDRLRLVHNVETKHWYAVSNVPFDATVDRVVTFDELFHEATGQIDNGRKGRGRRFYGGRLAEAFRCGNGVLSLTPAELVRLHPDLWGSERAARDDLPSAAVRVRTLQIDLIGKSAPLAGVEVRYRRPRQPGSPIPALVASDTRDPAVLLAKLEAVVGPVVHERFEVVPDPEPPPEPPPPDPPPPGEELEDASAPALDLPFEVVAAPPPALMRRIAERAGGRVPPRVLVLELLPLAPDPADPPETATARAEGCRDFVPGALMLAEQKAPALA